MSFSSGFGDGFDSSVDPLEQRFNDSVERRGEDVRIVRLTQTGVDDYNNPVYSETTTIAKAFVSLRGFEKEVPPGALKLARAKFLVKRGTEVGEAGYEIEYLGARYRVVAIDYRRSHLAITAERKVE